MTTTLIPVRRETQDLWDMAGELEEAFDAEIEALPRMMVREGLWHPTMDNHQEGVLNANAGA